jgi:hypothetical protein
MDQTRHLVGRRSASVALALVLYLPIDEIILIVAAYEELYIPPALNAVEGWFRKLDEQLSRYRCKTCNVRTWDSPTSFYKYLPAHIVDVNYISGNIGLIIQMPHGLRYELRISHYDCRLETPLLEFSTMKYPMVSLTVSIECQKDC